MIVIFKQIVLWDFMSGITVERCDGRSSIQIDQQDYPQAEDIDLFDRLNVSRQFSFTACRVMKTEDDAEQFAYIDHPEAVLGKGPLLMRSTFKQWERFFNTAACRDVSGYAEGCRVWMTYDFVTGLSAKKPG